MDDKSMKDDIRTIYELSQHSAEHHDTLLWEVTYIVWGATTLLLGFVLEAIQQQPLLCFLTALFSIFFSWIALHVAKVFRDVRNKKYEICKRIESTENLPWKPHYDTDEFYPKGRQTKLYRITTVVFTVVWSAVALVCLYLIVCRHHWM